jgi:spermidine/putrescine transport system substrate-binding protein
MSLFATNDELFAKLKAGNPGFDVIVPSNEFVTRMGQAGCSRCWITPRSPT